MRSFRFCAACILLLALTGLSSSGQKQVASLASLSSLVAALNGELRPQDAMAFMRDVYATDRFFTFPRFEKTAEYISRTMKAAGLTDVEIVRPRADGITQIGFWTMPLAWDAANARLTILNGNVPAALKILADYQRVPASLGMWSGPTPKNGVEAEIVEVSKADLRDERKLDLRGKLALMDQNPANVKWLLVRAGALGAINTFTENPGLMDGRQWINAWGDSGWAYTKRSTPSLSFSITPRQAAYVRELLKRGPVRAHAVVDSRYYEGAYPYVTGLIRGTGPEEVLTLGHTSEQGAQDNATGVAATLEALATLDRLIATGKLPRPRRSIRILSMGEMYGSMSYVASNPDRIHRTVAAMCVDTPAASYDLAGTEYTFYMNPRVASDFTDAFILKLAEEYFPRVHRPWHEKPFTTGTDTYMAEPMVGVPTVWGYSGSGVETHHNSEDTPDRVDARSLRDIAITNAAFLYFIANAGESEALWLAGLSETRGHRQILKAGGPDQVEFALDRESQAVSSVLRLIPGDGKVAVQAKLAPMLERLRQVRRTAEARSAATPGSSGKRRGCVEDYCPPETIWHDSPRRSATRSMGRTTLRGVGGRAYDRIVLVRRASQPGGSGAADAAGTGGHGFRLRAVLSVS